MGHYLVCYDIANPKRLAKVHRRAVKYAAFVQYSVYYLQGDEALLQLLLDEIEAQIDPEFDDVRAYKTSPLSQALQLGQQWLPDEIVMV